MTLKILAAIAYGVLVLAGGVVGYIQAKSKPSLISGSISGALLIIGGLMEWNAIPIGLTVAKVVTIALLVVFTLRLVKTRKFIPAGLMLITGVATLAILFS